MKKAYFAAGCFWGVEKSFFDLDGVVDTRAGYAGGEVENPTYELVCGGNTGHAETVEVAYDPEKTSFEALVRFFFTIHDPTQVDRQGPDVGEQYRSIIFYETEEEKEIAERVIAELREGKAFSAPIATQVEKLPVFYEAEEYHQKYAFK